MNFKKGDRVRVEGVLRRPITSEEHQAWLDGPHSKGMDEAGETKLAPSVFSLWNPRDLVLEVVRSRAAVRFTNWRPPSGCAELRDEDGNVWYARRDSIRPV